MSERNGGRCEKRADGRIALSRTVDDKRLYGYGRTKKEAREKLEKAIEKFKEEQEKQGNPGSITLDEYFKHYQDARRSSIKPITINATANRFKNISEKLGKKKLQEVQKKDILSFREYLISKYSTGFSNGVLSLLSSIFKMAVEERVIEWNPCNGVRSARKKNDEKPARETIHRALSRQETEKLLKTAEDQHSWYTNIIKLMLNTGMRIGEVGAIMLGDIDLEKK